MKPGFSCRASAVRTTASRILYLSIAISLFSTLVIPFSLSAQSIVANSPAITAQNRMIVIGFVGWILKHDDTRRSEVKLSEHLRRDYPDTVVTAVFEHYKGGQAHALIMRELNPQHEGTLSDEVKAQARIVIYGHSWGASEAIALARQLKKEGIPVLYTAQVDSVTKIGEHDGVIPSNVLEAVNYFQRYGTLRGRSKIRAEDPKHTRIIGNFHMDYRNHPVACPDYPFYETTVARTHGEIECDPQVWDQIEDTIRSKISLTAKN